MQAEEFERSMDIDELELHENGVFVLWKWDWVDTNSDSDDDQPQDNAMANGGGVEIHSDKEGTDSETAVLSHSVTFKCIGASRDMNSQVTLS